MNTKLHAVSNAAPELLHDRRAGQQLHWHDSLLDDLPKAQWLLGDRSYDAGGFQMPRKPSASNLHPSSEIPYRTARYDKPVQGPQPHRDRDRPPEGLASRRNSLRSMPHSFLLGIALAATVIFWL
jgi:hypothetical protein